MPATEAQVQLRSAPLKAAAHLRQNGNFQFLNNEPGIFTTYELARLIEQLAEQLDSEDEAVGKRLWRIFAPTCAWDDANGDSQLGEEVFHLIENVLKPMQVSPRSQK